MTLSAALGVNLWMLAVVVPIVVGGTFGTVPAGGVVWFTLLVLLCPAALAWGVWRRTPALLFVGFPLLAVLPMLIRESTGLVLPAAPFVLLGASLAAYLVATARGLQRAAIGDASGPEIKAAPLAPEAIAPRWRRRMRLYRALSFASLVLPLTLIWTLDLRRTTVEALDRSYSSAGAPHADAVRALYTAGIAILALFVFRSYLVAPLETHLQRDRETVAALDALRRHTRTGRPRASFYFFVVVALGAMAAVVWERAR